MKYILFKKRNADQDIVLERKNTLQASYELRSNYCSRHIYNMMYCLNGYWPFLKNNKVVNCAVHISSLACGG